MASAPGVRAAQALQAHGSWASGLGRPGGGGGGAAAEDPAVSPLLSVDKRETPGTAWRRERGPRRPSLTCSRWLPRNRGRAASGRSAGRGFRDVLGALASPPLCSSRGLRWGPVARSWERRREHCRGSLGIRVDLASGGRATLARCGQWGSIEGALFASDSKSSSLCWGRQGEVVAKGEGSEPQREPAV